MGLFGKSAQQKRIDELAAENARLRLDAEGADATARMYQSKYRSECERVGQFAQRLYATHRALREIAESVTPHAAYRARKMAAVAKAALPAEIASHVRPKASAGVQELRA